MSFLLFCLIILVSVYLAVGIYSYVVYERYPPTMFPNNESNRLVAAALFLLIVGWPFFLFWRYIKLPDYLEDWMPYHYRIKLFRWLVVLGCLWALATFGPKLRQQINSNIEVEEPMASPLVSTDDTVQERPQVAHTRYEYYTTDLDQ